MDSFLMACENILKDELFTKYDGQLEHIATSGYTISTSYKRDDQTVRLLEDGILPMPINHRIPYEVWYFKAWFTADPSKEVEMLIGKFRNWSNACPLGMHDHQKWLFTPQAINLSLKVSRGFPLD